MVSQKWNGEFRSKHSNRNKWTTSRGDPEYSGREKPKRTFPPGGLYMKNCASAFKKVLLIQPSSVASKGVVFITENSFRNSQDRAMEKYFEVLPTFQ